MSPSAIDWKKRIRTLLILGRVSNVPTVWSNCFAGWLLGGMGPAWDFLLLCIGSTGAYIGGMYLNDAFDAPFDRQHRRERPIPSGAISEKEVWFLGTALLGFGAFCLAWFNWKTTLFTAFMTGSILLYNAVHKSVAFSPLLMALCRFFLYLVAASSAASGIDGISIWSAVALASYIVGLSYVARRESVGGFLGYWPCYLLAVPILFACLINTGEFLPKAIGLSILLVIWVAQCLRHLFWAANRQIGRTVSGLLAGIVLVDLVAVAGPTPAGALIFLLLFVGALIFQRSVPAT